MRVMEMKLTLPDEIMGRLGDEPEREVLEGVVLLLVGEGRLSLEEAGGVLGLGGEGASRWYAERVRSGSEGSFLADIPEPIFLENLTQEELDRLDRPFDIPPAEEGSGFSDVSINHDKYLAEGY